MFLNKIWERYFLWEVCKSTLFFLFCFYGLYVLIDYASHSASFHRHHIKFQWLEVALYYFCEFAKRVEVLLPFALLIATIRTLSALNVHNELIALMSSGISMRTLMRPFVFLGLFCTFLMYLNIEIILPIAMKELKLIDDRRELQKAKHRQKAAAQHLSLEDESTVIFQRYDSSQNFFFDAYWIRSIDDVYRIKYLYPNNLTEDRIPTGKFVDHLVRDAQGQLVVMETLDTKAFPNMRFNDQILLETITSPEEESLSELWNKLPEAKPILNEKESRILSAFYQKLAMPWLCLLAIMGAAPFCVRITRNLPIFFIYAGSIFGLVAVYLILDAAVLLGERQALAPFWAIWPVFALIAFPLSWRFVRVSNIA